MISSPPTESTPETIKPGLFRARIKGDVPLQDPLEDAAIIAYEYERRWQRWWNLRRWIMAGLLILPPALFILGLLLSLLGANGGGLLWLALVSLLALLVFLAYCWYTLPRLAAFGRVYRRLVAVPLSRNGTVWCDAAAPAPDFPALRDNFFALYRDSTTTGARTQSGEGETTSEDDEINRKKLLINDLSGMIGPLLDAAPDNVDTPFIASPRTACLDHLRLEGVNETLALELAGWSLPYNGTSSQPNTFTALAHDVEDYSNPDLLSGKFLLEAANEVEAEAKAAENSQNEAEIATKPPAESTNGRYTPTESVQETPVHRQIASKVDENLGLVQAETQRWEEHSSQVKAFFAGQVAHLQEARQTVQTGYEQVATALENEISPTVQQLDADTAFYQSQILRFYDDQREVVEGARDSVLGKLNRELHELQGYQEERLDEQSLMQAEFKGLNDQRLRLEASTDSRFETLNSQLSQLTGRTYNIPSPPMFRSNLPPDPAAVSMTTEEVLQGLAELRAESRLSINAVNAALNRYARLRFDPLDDLAQLEQELAQGTKWQATRWLGNIINFRQSGQLLALAGEVSDAVGVYLDATGDFERLNGRWCNLEAAVSQLGLATYAQRLGEAQQYLVNLSEVISSLHSNLAMAPHSPEMARPATFQSLYDLAAGLQRELEELGGLAANITRVEERLDQLASELEELAEYIARNKSETERVTEEASSRLSEIVRRQQSLEAKLAELKDTRMSIIRSHIENFRGQRDGAEQRLANSVSQLDEVGEIADKILKKHLSRSERLLEEARQLRRGLEGNIAAIVEEFEHSVIGDRCVLQPSELFVPIWFFQFQERPVWKRRMLGFAACYYSLNRLGPTTPEPRNLPSLFDFLFGQRTVVRYRLEEELEVEKLLGVHNLDYPAGRVLILPDTLEKLAADGWISPWLVQLLNRARPK